MPCSAISHGFQAASTCATLARSAASARPANADRICPSSARWHSASARPRVALVVSLPTHATRYRSEPYYGRPCTTMILIESCEGGTRMPSAEAESADPRAYVRLAAMIRSQIRDGRWERASRCRQLLACARSTGMRVRRAQRPTGYCSKRESWRVSPVLAISCAKTSTARTALARDGSRASVGLPLSTADVLAWRAAPLLSEVAARAQGCRCRPLPAGGCADPDLRR